MPYLPYLEILSALFQTFLFGQNWQLNTQQGILAKIPHTHTCQCQEVLLAGLGAPPELHLTVITIDVARNIFTLSRELQLWCTWQRGQNHKPHTHTHARCTCSIKEKIRHGNVSRVGFSWLMELAVRGTRTRRSTGNLPGNGFKASL